MKRSIKHRCRAVVLVTAMWIVIALTAVVLVLCREMTVESMITKHELSQAKADAAELGVEQFVLSAIAGDVENPGYLGNISGYQGVNAMQQGEMGDCYFWILKTNPDDDTTPAYGLTAESGKIDLNYITYNQLMLLPNMTDAAASSIIDWRSLSPTDISTSLTGQEDNYYMTTYGYHCKNAPFDSVDELRLVSGIVDEVAPPEILFDADLNHDGLIEPNEQALANTGDSFNYTMRGIMPGLTVYGVNASNPQNLTASASTSGTGGGATAGVASTNAMVDVNNATNLRNLLTQDGVTAGGAAAPTGGYKSVFDWAVRSGLSSTDLSLVYTQLCCIPTGGTVGGRGGGGGGGGGAATTPPAKTPLVDINEASEATLVALGFQDTDAQAIIAYRQTNNVDPSQRANISWLLDVVQDHTIFTMATTDGSPYLAAQITGVCGVYSADIVTVSRDGRAFKRVKIIVDGSSLVTDPDTGLLTGGSPQIVYRRDLTEEGWPLDPQIRDALRSGKPITQGN